MELEVSNKILLDNLKIAQMFTTERHRLFRCVKLVIKNGKITILATNLENSVKIELSAVNSEGECEILLPVKVLINILSCFDKDSNITFFMHDKEQESPFVIIRSSLLSVKTKYVLNIIPANDFAH